MPRTDHTSHIGFPADRGTNTVSNTITDTNKNTNTNTFRNTVSTYGEVKIYRYIDKNMVALTANLTLTSSSKNRTAMQCHLLYFTELDLCNARHSSNTLLARPVFFWRGIGIVRSTSGILTHRLSSTFSHLIFSNSAVAKVFMVSKSNLVGFFFV